MAFLNPDEKRIAGALLDDAEAHGGYSVFLKPFLSAFLNPKSPRWKRNDKNVIYRKTVPIVISTPRPKSRCLATVWPEDPPKDVHFLLNRVNIPVIKGADPDEVLRKVRSIVARGPAQSSFDNERIEGAVNESESRLNDVLMQAVIDDRRFVAVHEASFVEAFGESPWYRQIEDVLRRHGRDIRHDVFPTLRIDLLVLERKSLDPWLVIEFDGDGHFLEGAAEKKTKDDARDAFLTLEGFPFLRIQASRQCAPRPWDAFRSILNGVLIHSVVRSRRQFLESLRDEMLYGPSYLMECEDDPYESDPKMQEALEELRRGGLEPGVEVEVADRGGLQEDGSILIEGEVRCTKGGCERLVNGHARIKMSGFKVRGGKWMSDMFVDAGQAKSFVRRVLHGEFIRQAGTELGRMMPDRLDLVPFNDRKEVERWMQDSLRLLKGIRYVAVVLSEIGDSPRNEREGRVKTFDEVVKQMQMELNGRVRSPSARGQLTREFLAAVDQLRKQRDV